MGSAMGTAFRNEPNFAYMLPGVGQRERPLSWFFGSFVAKLGLSHGEVYTTPEARGGAVWFAPGQTPSALDSVRAGLLEMPFHFGLRGTQRAAKLGDHLESLRGDLAPEPHWYLVALGVSPDVQGRGLGRSLLQPVLGRADADNTPCYLETFLERGAAFYGRLGFEVVRTDTVPGGPDFWCMKRTPNLTKLEG